MSIPALALSWLVKNPLTSALIAAILLLSVGVAWQAYRIKDVRAEAAEARAALVTEQAAALVCESNTIALEGAVEDQNKATQELGKEADKIVKGADERANQVLRQPLPTLKAPGAEAMNNWLDSL